MVDLDVVKLDQHVKYLG